MKGLNIEIFNLTTEKNLSYLVTKQVIYRDVAPLNSESVNSRNVYHLHDFGQHSEYF